jgi:regulator of protease activity HflC (stomatin/prohibitin superfamily)
VVVLPFVDQLVRVDLREKVLSLEGKGGKSVTATTREGERLEFDLSATYQVMDPEKSVLQTADLEQTLGERLASGLRGRVADLGRGEVFARRKALANEVLEELRSTAEAWGVKVSGVEVMDVR